MKIQVLGSGCPTCKEMHELVQKAVEDLQLDISVDYITGSEGIQKIIQLGCISSPVLTIDDEVAMVGFDPDIAKIKDIVQKASK